VARVTVNRPVSSARETSASAGRVVRHRGWDRLYHWLMAISVLTLLGTAFLPIVGWKFAWVDIHWMAGVALAALVLFHIVRSTIWLDIGSMMIWPRDVGESWSAVRHELASGPPPPKPGKYPLLQRGYHAFIAIVILAAIGTGGLMMMKIDTPFWVRNPYFLSQSTWGTVYVIHGLAAMTVLALVIVHIYFAIRPEKLWITRSMIVGWITGAEYRAHHDPARWQPEPKTGD
jgi:cytochrome b subunit of formate dehydrogenase